MDKRKELKMQQLNVNDQFKEIENILLHGHGLEPITNDLIKKLIKEKGIPKRDLKNLQKQGAKYSVTRNSFFFPSELR